jgi:hypothetical protein
MFAQNVRWDADQQKVTAPRRVHGATGARAGDGVLSSLYDQPQRQPASAEQLRTLRQHYTLVDEDCLIIALLEEDEALYSLLLEAVKPLEQAFGAQRIVQVRVQTSDEDRFLKVAVQLPADFGADPEGVLRAFDEEWWLHNCHRAGGALVFDYEMQDAI